MKTETENIENETFTDRFLRIAGRERFARAADEAARSALALALVGHARRAGVELEEEPFYLAQKLAVVADQSQLKGMTHDMQAMTDWHQFLRDHGVEGE